MNNDLISRQQAIDAADVYMKRLCRYIGTSDDTRAYAFARGLLVGIKTDIGELPSAQPEIIRCNDCKYAEYIDDVQTLWCTECGQGRTVAPDDFCSYAER